MSSVLGTILPLALVVTISPINIIPAILILFSSRPMAGALSFLAGFVAAVAGVLGLLMLIAGAVNRSHQSSSSTWASVVEIFLGVGLLVAAAYKFRSRPRDDDPGSMPKWMTGVSGYGPGHALGAGFALGALNPKNLVVGFAAAAAISSALLPAAQQIAAVAIYVVVASLGVASPIVVMLVLGDKAPPLLESWNTWLRANNAKVMATLFAIFGVVLIAQGAASM